LGGRGKKEKEEELTTRLSLGRGGKGRREKSRKKK